MLLPAWETTHKQAVQKPFHTSCMYNTPPQYHNTQHT
jgi:hypothetical protein